MNDLVKLIEKLVNNPDFKSVKITGWQDFGDDGPAPLPKIKIVKFTSKEQNK